MKKAYPIILFAAICAPSLGLSAITISAMTTFGNGDGWRAPGEVVSGDLAGTATGSTYNYLGIGALERGMAYNPVTKNIVVVSRSTAGNGLRVLNGSTGADAGFLNQGTGIISGGTFTTSMIDVDANGVLYVCNLSTSAAAAFKIYRWSSETATAPTVSFNALSGLVRTGDSFALTGTGSSTVFAAAGTSPGANNSNFAIMTGASTTVATAYTTIASTTNGSNDYRLSLTFVDSNTLIGNQGGAARITDFAGSASVTGSVPLSAAQRPIDYIDLWGTPALAVLDANNSVITIYDITNPTAPISMASMTTTTGTLTANGNGTGSVSWGEITSTTATLYAMSTNQGIQAFTITNIPEPTSIALLGMLSLVGLRRRK
jgi:hypothetical protein